MISIQEIKAEETYIIRKQELRKNLDLPSAFTGDFDKDTIHVGLYYDGDLASVVSFMNINYKNFIGNQYQLRGMATKEIYQGKGYGKLLIEWSENLLIANKTEIIWCNARVIALGFYAKLGFRTVGNEFNIPQIGGHFVMYKKLN